MGSITPPVGLNLFVMKSVAPSVKMETLFKGVWPFVGTLLVCIFIIIAIPSLATWLPNLFFG
jgi:TRAP-type C4-dicarboxylate transport system permease large subunit